MGWLLSSLTPDILPFHVQNAGKKNEGVSHRWSKCACGYENDRDVIAIVNLNGRGSPTPSSAPQMRDVLLNRWWER